MTRAEFAILLAVPIAAIGVGLWVHLGAGLVTFALGLAGWGFLELRFPDNENVSAPPFPVDEDVA